MQIKRVRQRYTCLEASATGGLLKYEGLESGFTTNLPVDVEGFVLDYPPFWVRLMPK